MIAHYRQWQLPQELKSNANQYNSQEYRYSKTIKIFSSILEDNSHSIFIGDDNIDTLNNHNFHHNSNNIFLKNIRDEFIASKNIIVHNKKPTFHRKNQTSCIDHIYSNCASHINNVTTSKNILSDHNYIYCT